MGKIVKDRIIYGGTPYLSAETGDVLSVDESGNVVGIDPATLDTKVTQIDSSADARYRILLSNSASSTTEVAEVKKSDYLRFNPSIGSLTLGSGCTASGRWSYAQGYDSHASGYLSHAEGYSNASGQCSHAEGSSTAVGECSHAEGDGTYASHLGQHVFGAYNIPDNSNSPSDQKGNYIEIVGNGGDIDPQTIDIIHSNARTLDWDGNEVLAGKLTLGAAPTANMDATTKLYVDTGLSGKVEKSGDTMTGPLIMNGGNADIQLKTSGSSSDDSSDIVWYYGNGNEKARLWTSNTYTAAAGINYRVYKNDGTALFSGTIPLRDTTYTIATGDNNGQIKVTPSSGSAYNVSVKGLGSAAYLTANTAASNSTVVQRNSSGYIYANYFNTTCGAANPSSYTNSRALFTSDDGFIRKATAANFRTMLGLGSMATADTSSYVAKAGDTMSGNLTVSVSGEGQFSTKSTAWGMNTSSNNGLSQNASAGAFYHKDKNDNIVARTNCYGQSDGQTVLCIQSYNRTTSNAEVMTGLWIWSKKNGTHAYTVTDAAAFRTGIGAAASSSRAYKENIQNMTEEEAKKILNVNIYSYDYKDGFGENNHNKNQFGVIAEEVIEQIPYAVNIPDKYDEEEALKSSNDPSKGGRNLITIDYWKFVPHLIKTVQVQEKRINELEEEIKAIKEAIGL